MFFAGGFQDSLLFRHQMVDDCQIQLRFASQRLDGLFFEGGNDLLRFSYGIGGIGQRFSLRGFFPAYGSLDLGCMRKALDPGEE